MAAQKGSALLLKIGDGASPEVFTTVGGLRSTSITMNEEAVDVTTKDNNGHRALLAGGGTNSVSVSGSGVFTDAASETSLKDAYFAQQNTSDGSSAQTAAFNNFQIIVPDFGTFTGSFMIASMEYAGEFNGETTYSVTLESNGYITFAAV
jgi:TP901-1 family phage major tail protein